jgi:hypothetical protein
MVKYILKNQQRQQLKYGGSRSKGTFNGAIGLKNNNDNN